MKLMTFACIGSLAAAAGCSSTNQATSTSMDAGNGGTDAMSSSEASQPMGEAGVYGNTGQPACDAIDLPAPASGAGVQLQISQTLGSGQESEVCQLVKIEQDLDVNSSVASCRTPRITRFSTPRLTTGRSRP
jgi:hypothetical protein